MLFWISKHMILSGLKIFQQILWKKMKIWKNIWALWEKWGILLGHLELYRIVLEELKIRSIKIIQMTVLLKSVWILRRILTYWYDLLSHDTTQKLTITGGAKTQWIIIIIIAAAYHTLKNGIEKQATKKTLKWKRKFCCYKLIIQVILTLARAKESTFRIKKNGQRMRTQTNAQGNAGLPLCA